ncbi:MAG: ribonuclease H family protein [Acidimicrobiales bacterium]
MTPAATPVKVYTDGACIGNPGPGGWAWALPAGEHASGAEPLTTNQRMEVRAVLEALQVLEGAVTVVSDSTYVVNCFRQSWWKGWQVRAWRNTAGKPVANQDLWRPLIELVVGRRDVTFLWVKGHAGDPGNELADRLANEAARSQRPCAGRASPTARPGR